MSCRVLVTAFEPYDRWSENSSWLALVEFTKAISADADITTRLYPVDFAEVRRRLEKDLLHNFDYALHLGQAPGSAQIRLEAVGLNLGGDSRKPSEQCRPLVEDGPVGYRSNLPLAEWVSGLRQVGIPANLSYHAGTYLCNATLYLTHYLAEKMSLKTEATFLHLPLETAQAAREPGETASLPAPMVGQALQVIVASLVRQAQLRDRELA